MNDIIRAAFSMGLPCIHIEYYCGNKFYPSCSGTKENPHEPANAICPTCGEPVLAECTNVLNKNLKGHYDIIGIAWAIETKHKINKGAQDATLDPAQSIRRYLYDLKGVPNISANESNDKEVLAFLYSIKEKLNEFFSSPHTA